MGTLCGERLRLRGEHDFAINLSNPRPLGRLIIGDASCPPQPSKGAPLMQYLLMIYSNAAAMAAATEANSGKMLAAYSAYAEAMGKAGVLQGGNRLRPTAASTTVRVANGKTTVLDGPYAETKEQLGGYFLIDVPDLDAALSWAERCPGASTGVVEVRPIWAM
jgi:hypothetical protein